MSLVFFQEVGTLMPLQSSHQRKSQILCFSKGSVRFAPGISSGKSVISSPILQSFLHTQLLAPQFNRLVQFKVPRDRLSVYFYARPFKIAYTV